MRLFLLPISTRRTLIYCQKSEQSSAASPSLLDRITTKANATWASWERKDRGWQKKVTQWGNVLLRRIPFEEWGLKTIPPLSSARRQQLAELASRGGGQKDEAAVEVLFPGLFLREDRVPAVLRALATERQALHRRKMIWSLVGIPLTLPFALVPVIPNFPGFYLAFRAYSHWKALRGSAHLAFLVQHSLFKPSPSSLLSDLYVAGLMHPSRLPARSAPPPTPEQRAAVAALIDQQTRKGEEDVMLLQRWNGKLLAERFRLPDMEVEIERAVEQVEGKIKAEEELREEKEEIERAVGAKEARPKTSDEGEREEKKSR